MDNSRLEFIGQRPGAAEDELFVGAGEMRARCRNLDWAMTPLGPLGGWPATLRTAVAIVMAAPQPMWIGWGQELIQIYNDAYTPFLKGGTPSLGKPARETWAEIWPVIGPMIERVCEDGAAVHEHDRLIPHRGGHDVHDVYVSASYSAIVDPLARHGIGGVLSVAVDTTARVQAMAALQSNAAREGYLLHLTDALRPLGDAADIQAAACEVIGHHLGAERVNYAEIDGEQYVVSREYHVPQLATMVGRYDMASFRPAERAAFEAGRTVALADILSEPNLTPGEAAAYSALGVRAFVSVPLVKNGRLVVVLSVIRSRPGAWTQEEVALVEETAERTWSAVERARAEERLRSSEEKYRTLFDSIDEGFCTIEVLFDEHERAVDYRFLDINRSFEQQTGIVNAAGRRMREIAREHEEHWFEIYGRIAKTGRAERFVNRAEQLGRWYDVCAFRIGAPEQRLVGILFNDITARKQAEDALHASLEEREALLKELHHRVKNNLQVITSMLDLQAHQTADPTTLSALNEAANRVTAIASIHELLYQSGTFARVDLASYTRRLVPHVVSLYRNDARIQVAVSADSIDLDLARAVPFGLLLNELVSNVCKHAFASSGEGQLTVTLRPDNGHFHLRVADTGVGLPPGFDEQMATTLGLQIVRELSTQLGGTVRFTSGDGTTVDVRAPIDLKS